MQNGCKTGAVKSCPGSLKIKLVRGAAIGGTYRMRPGPESCSGGPYQLAAV